MCPDMVKKIITVSTYFLLSYITKCMIIWEISQKTDSVSSDDEGLQCSGAQCCFILDIPCSCTAVNLQF